ncbi:MAG TPA: DUF4253 domain-containing protein [Planctomycetota bacterium]|nr:DUF4253 domain-containing protein [Planctomycetota bacterium]
MAAEGLKSLDLEAIGEKIPSDVRGSAEIRPWLFAGDLLCAALLDAKGARLALELWQRLRKILSGLGALPVVVGSHGDAMELEDRCRERTREQLARAVAQAITTSGASVLSRLATERPDDPSVDKVTLSPAELAPRDDGFAFVEESKGRVSVAIVATPIPALVPVYLGFGGQGGAPPPADVGSVLALWNERHGPLDVVYASGDTMEVEVARPPKTAEEAKRLAREHYAFCDGIVRHGNGTTADLARQLAGARRWLFWWNA